jgi:hypothetical protein
MSCTDSVIFISLNFTSLHFTSLHFNSLHFTSLHFTSLQLFFNDLIIFTSLHWNFFLMISTPTLAATTGLLYQPQMIGDGDCGEIDGMKIGRGNRSTRRKPAPPLIPHDQTRGWPRAAAVGSQPLTAWAMARPVTGGQTYCHLHIFFRTISTTVCLNISDIFHIVFYFYCGMRELSRLPSGHVDTLASDVPQSSLYVSWINR